LASANSILVKFVSTTGSSPNFSWNYTADLAGTSGAPSELRTNDYFALADFAGLNQAATTTANAGLTNWVVSYPATTAFPFPGALSETGATNVVFTYKGTATIPSDVSPLVTFSVISSIGFPSTLIAYGGADHATAANGGAAQSNFGAVAGPSAVPLPPALWAGLSLMGMMGVKGYRRQQLNKTAE